MRRVLFVLLFGIGLAACSTPYGEFGDISKIPGVEPGDGNNNYNEMTTYKGALLPDNGFYGAQGMVEVLKLIEQQDGEIDDVRFVEQLEAKIFDCERRFIYLIDRDGEEPDWWSDASDWCGAQMFYSLALYDDGTFVQKMHPSCACVGEEYDYIYKLGHKGWSKRGVWRYDSESDMLYTSEDERYVAKLLYFDEKCAVLEGHIYPMWMYEDRTGSYNYRRESPMELYYFTFNDGKEDYLDGFELTYEEYSAIIEEYRETYLKFEGKLLPDQGTACEKMRECIELLSLQEAEDIDDAKFVEMLTTMTLGGEDRFSTSSDLAAWVSGSSASVDNVGIVSSLGDMMAEASGSCDIRSIVHEKNEKYDALMAAGCYGWYESGVWSYDAASNTLTIERGGKSYEAVVCYFDAESYEVVLRGKVGFILDFGSEHDILRCQFAYPACLNYLGGYLSYEEFVELWESL